MKTDVVIGVIAAIATAAVLLGALAAQTQDEGVYYAIDVGLLVTGAATIGVVVGMAVVALLRR